MARISATMNTCGKHLYLRGPTTVLVLLYLTASTVEQQLRYSPVDDVAIDCGSLGNTTGFDKRSWIGDILNSKYFNLEGQKDSVILEAAEQRPITMDTGVPYRTARPSRSNFTYKIPVTPGPKLIRLYFSSASYEGFDRSTAFFSIKVGPYTLLSNFSVLLNANDLRLQSIAREFCVTAEQSSLNITFTPSSLISAAYAFINGIEVVSMPSALYYSEAEGNQVRLLSQNVLYTLSKETALETMYRLNVGGRFIYPVGDTGMFRQWDQDDNYLTEVGVSVLPVLNTTTELKFRDNLSSYAAPADVYRTARSMGNSPNKTLIRSYNLTWEMPVDSGFTYLLRLHFCEIEPEIFSVGDRVFNIYIANQTAENNFDLIRSSGGQYVPYFRDYAVLKLVGEGAQKKINLSVALQAKPDDAASRYVDAILNGLEIFKLNDTTGNLAGPNPDPASPPATNVPPPTPQRKEKNNRTAIIAIVSGVVSGVIVLFVLGFFVLRRGRQVKD